MKGKGFSLIELLVVIAIIALLISMITPSLRAVKKQAHSIKCASNLSQLALGMTIYCQDNGTFPLGFDDATYIADVPPGGHLGNAAYDKIGLWWLNRIIDTEITRNSISWCPARIAPDLKTRVNVLCENYGVNRSICKDSGGTTGTIGSEFVGRPLSEAHIRNTSETLLIVDSGYSLVSWTAATNDVSPHFDNYLREKNFYIPGISINQSRPIDISKTPQAITGRHPKAKVNISYVDGHVSKKLADSFTVTQTGTDYINRNTLWLGK